MESTEKLEEKMAEQGLDPKGIKADGAVHRFSVDGDRRGQKSGAYCSNGEGFGWFRDWRNGDGTQIVFEGDDGKNLSKEAKLLKDSRKIWDAATDPTGHPYLTRKQIKPHGRIRQHESKLIIPVFSINGQWKGLQKISAEGEKLFISGARKKGNFFAIPGNRKYVVCEGFATGVSIHMATGYSVVVAFDKDNLLPAAEKICAKAGTDNVVIAADNDSWKIAEGKDNVGTEKAEKAASVTGAGLAIPFFKKSDGANTTDFNDLHVLEGAAAVKALIDGARVVEGSFADIEPVDMFGDTILTGRPKFPDCACPKPIINFAKDEAERIGVVPEMIALPAIVCAAIVINDEFTIQPKKHDPTWSESARLWVAIVAESGQKKTPCFSTAVKPIQEIEKDNYFHHQEEMAEYKRLKAIYDKDKKDALNNSTTLPAEPEKPTHKRYIADDITIEALRRILENNTQGVGVVKDELAGWITSFDRYQNSRQGSKDRADYCELYQGGHKLFDRAEKGCTFVPNWGASIMGFIQPGPIRRTFGDITDDGMLARFLVCQGKREGRGEDRQPNYSAINTYRQLIKRLSELKPKVGDETFLFSDEAIKYREIIYSTCERVQILPDSSEALIAHLDKWEAIYCRITLVFHVIEAVSAGNYPKKYISEKTAKMAARLMIDFLLPNSTRFYHETLDDGSRGSHAKWIAGYILTQKLNSITRRDIERNYKKLKQKPKELSNTMETLYQSGWVDPEKLKKNGTVTGWKVNPKVHTIFAEQARQEAARRAAERKKIQDAVETFNLVQEGE